MIIKNAKGDQLADICPDADGFMTIADMDIPGADLSKLIMEGWCFDGSRLDEADFSSSDLYWARLYDVTARRARFVETRLNGANLTHSTFIECDFSRAVFSRGGIGSAADFRWSNFSGSIFIDADLRGVDYNGRTTLPPDVDPCERGMVLRDDEADGMSGGR